MMVADLQIVEYDLGFRYELDDGSTAHYQQVCPRCRRALFGLAQGRLWADARNRALSGATEQDHGV
jgi:hypothetical protein